MPNASAAVFSVIAEHVERYREEVAELVRSNPPGHRDDVVAAMYEAERALRNAGRSLRRAAKLAG